MIAPNPKSRRGRPRCETPVQEREWLTIPGVVVYLRLKGRSKDRRKIKAAIVRGALMAYLDYEHLDRLKQPTYRIRRVDVDRWLSASLVPVRPKSVGRRTV